MDEFEKELKEDFLAEALEMLDEFEQIFLSLDEDQSPEALDKIFRFAHNLKGTSRAVGFGDIAEFTHEMENLILAIKKNELKINDSIIQTLLECNDHVQMMVTKLNEDLESRFNSSKIIEQIKTHLVAPTELNSISPALKIVENNSKEIKPVANIKKLANEFSDEELQKALNDMIIDNSAITQSSPEEKKQAFSEEQLEQALADMTKAQIPVIKSTKLDVLKTEFSDSELESALQNNSPKQDIEKNDSNHVKNINKRAKAQNINASKKEEYLRVSLSKIKKINEFVGELVILQSVFQGQQQSINNSNCSITSKTVNQLGKISKELQDISMSLRMIPIKSTLQKMNRIVRDTARTLNKKVNLVISGESTEVDKSILELIVDPLVHIVRNAVDHGVELPNEREVSGKEVVGTIHLKAFHKGNNLLIEVIDDGKGIDTVSLREKAISKGIINESSNLSDLEIMNLIFHAGFSTKEQVSEVSGRGVGMDVVKTNIQKLGGSVKVFSKLGEGSRFEIVLPLTMAIIDGVVVTTGNDKFVLPLNQVKEFIKPENDKISHISNIGDCLSIRGLTLPIFDLSKKLGQGNKSIEDEDFLLVIASNHEKSFAIKIKEILNQQQTVVKKLGSDIKDQQGLIGASILGDGNPAFIVDVENLFENELKLIPDLNGKDVI